MGTIGENHIYNVSILSIHAHAAVTTLLFISTLAIPCNNPP